MKVYADNAATTKMSRTAIDAMLPYMETIYGNPSSQYSIGQEAAEALQRARETMAKHLGCEAREITFTSGGSEADTQAIFSAPRSEKKGQKQIVSTAFELTRSARA
jgi:cysteine desulfurase